MRLLLIKLYGCPSQSHLPIMNEIELARTYFKYSLHSTMHDTHTFTHIHTHTEAAMTTIVTIKIAMCDIVFNNNDFEFVFTEF